MLWGREARRAGLNAVVHVWVPVEGRQSRIEVERSSGDLEFDRMAVRAAARVRFVPASIDGRLVEVVASSPFGMTHRS